MSSQAIRETISNHHHLAACLRSLIKTSSEAAYLDRLGQGVQLTRCARVAQHLRPLSVKHRRHDFPEMEIRRPARCQATEDIFEMIRCVDTGLLWLALPHLLQGLPHRKP